jgi:hypothetical protein
MLRRGWIVIAAIAWVSASPAQPLPDSTGRKQSPSGNPPAARSAGASGLTATGEIVQKPEGKTTPNRFATRPSRLEAKPLDWNRATGRARVVPVPPPAPLPQVPQSLQPQSSQEPRGLSPPPAGSAGPLFIKGGGPNPAGRAAAQKLYPAEWEALRRLKLAGAIDNEFGEAATKLLKLVGASSDIYTQYCENCGPVDNATPPAIGKLFFRVAGTPASCSAALIGPKNMALTAGHCCFDRDTGSWTTDVQFAPGYSAGHTPYGMYAGKYNGGRVLTSWPVNGDIPSDVCLVPLQTDANGKSANYYASWLGIAWNWWDDTVEHALGYPRNIGGAQSLEACVAQTFSTDDAECGNNRTIVNMGCSMTHGSSGGPWIYRYRTENYITSVVHGYCETAGTIGQTFSGARITSSNLGNICADEGGCW